MTLGINIYISLCRACLVTLVYSTVPWTYSSTILWMYRKKRRKTFHKLQNNRLFKEFPNNKKSSQGYDYEMCPS